MKEERIKIEDEIMKEWNECLEYLFDKVLLEVSDKVSCIKTEFKVKASFERRKKAFDNFMKEIDNYRKILVEETNKAKKLYKRISKVNCHFSEEVLKLVENNEMSDIDMKIKLDELDNRFNDVYLKVVEGREKYYNAKYEWIERKYVNDIEKYVGENDSVVYKVISEETKDTYYDFMFDFESLISYISNLPNLLVGVYVATKIELDSVKNLKEKLGNTNTMSVQEKQPSEFKDVVVIANKYRDALPSNVLKRLEGEYTAEEITNTFKNMWFDKMIIDVTALKDYKNIETIRKLSLSLVVDKIILLLDDSSETLKPEYLSNLISMGIYNFTMNADGIKYLIEHPNTYKDVKDYHKLS